MAPHISENLSRLKNSTFELNKLADEATVQIRALSKFLDELNPGIEVYDKHPFQFGRDDNASGQRAHARYTLAYGRDDNGKYGLVVEAEVADTEEYEEGRNRAVKDNYGNDIYSVVWATRLDQTSRQMRINAVARLPEFIAHLSDKVESAVAEVRGNLEKVREASAELQSALAENVAGDHRVATPGPMATAGAMGVAEKQFQNREVTLKPEDLDTSSRRSRSPQIIKRQ